MPRPLRTILWLTCAALTVPLACWGALLAAGRSPTGVRIEGVPIPAATRSRAAVARRAGAWEDEVVRLRVRGTIIAQTRRELGAQVDRSGMQGRIDRLGRTGNPLTDIPAWWRAWSGETDLRFDVQVNEATVEDRVEGLAEELDREPQPAELDARGRLVTLSADGFTLDRDGAQLALVTALREGALSVALPGEVTSSGVGEDALPLARPEPSPIRMARYRTELGMRGHERNRGHNVATAASYLDGAVIPPHGRLSFNDQVGARSRDRGYRMAHVILNGEMVDGMGGGVCQVASTLHAAAFLAGLTVVDHTPHSRPSAYIPMGLDATVVWPNVDLGVVNPHPFPVTVRAWARDGDMVVELFGQTAPRRVTWSRRTLATEEYGDRYVEDEGVPEGRERVSQRGILGYTIVRERTIEDARGVLLEEHHVRYPPTDRVIRVPVGSLDPATGTLRVSRFDPPANPY
ncbi:MAG: VanW family protein [Sandaracinaceae bacterium]